MATVLLPYNQLPPHHLTNTTQTTANSGLDPVNEFEKQLRLCEANAIPEADAQEVIDKLDQVSPNYCLTADAFVELVYRF